MRARVDGDGVRRRGKEREPELAQTVPGLGEHGDDAALGGDVEPAERAVEGKHVGRVADARAARHLHRAQVEGEQAGVLVTGDERQSSRGVDVEAVVAGAALERYSTDDL